MTDKDKVHQGVVALDCDGVLLDFLAHFKNMSEKALDRPLQYQKNVYNLQERFGLSEKELKHAMGHFYKTGWDSLPAIQDAVTSAIRLQESGFRVVVVTALPEEFKTERLKNLKDHGFTPNEIYCVGVHNGHTKAEAFHVEQPIAVADDRLIYLKEAKSVINGQVELVWVNDQVPQDDGHDPDFVNHEVSVLSEWSNAFLEKHAAMELQKSEPFKNLKRKFK